jgi:hypothetical protein
MGSPEKVYPHKRLRHINKKGLARLKRRISAEIKKDPGASAIISAHRKLTQRIRKKLGKIP